jgi:hypothetical protein
MHSKRISPKRRGVCRWWLVKRFSRDAWLKLAQAATVEDLRRYKRRFYPGLKTKIVQAR